MKHIKVTVTGKVQGVFYRAFTKRKANTLDIVGFVENRTDGSVYFEAEGAEEDLETLLGFCRRGPLRAKVLSLTVEEGKLVYYSGFEVRKKSIFAPRKP